MPRTSWSRSFRCAAVTAALGASLTLTGCGFDAQTLQPYTPADGINVTVKGGPQVLGLLIIANGAGKGRLSASILSSGKTDTLTGVTAAANTSTGTQGGAASVGAVNLSLPADKLVVLTATGVPPIPVVGSDLKPGLTANVTLTFASGAVAQATVPIMSVASPNYKTAAPELG